MKSMQWITACLLPGILATAVTAQNYSLPQEQRLNGRQLLDWQITMAENARLRAELERQRTEAAARSGPRSINNPRGATVPQSVARPKSVDQGIRPVDINTVAPNVQQPNQPNPGLEQAMAQPARPINYPPQVQPTALVPEPGAEIRKPGYVMPDQSYQAKPSLARYSYMTAPIPEPKQYKVHDLVTIIVRESHEASSAASLDTNKTNKWDMELKHFPTISLNELWNMDISGTRGELAGNPPRLEFDTQYQFQGDGNTKRKDEITTRIQARVMDVKPNGTLVLQASKTTGSDDEMTTITLTGYARSDDINSSDNSVLSTQVADLKVHLAHSGRLRDNEKQGLLTQALNLVFNF